MDASYLFYALGAVGNLSSLSLLIIGFSTEMANGFAVRNVLGVRHSKNFIQSKETVKAEDLRMVVDGNGNITWKTSSHKSTASVRFRTLGWYFQFSYKDAETGKIIDSPKDPVYVELSNGNINAKIKGKTTIYKFHPMKYRGDRPNERTYCFHMI